MADNNQTNNYISLQEATKYCVYTQEYLSLRARQGKLKATKFGRNWVTTQEWLKEYLAQVEEYNNNFKNNKLEEIKKEIPLFSFKRGGVPENLPVGELKLVPVKPLYFQVSEIFEQAVKKIIFSPTVRFGFIYSITLVLIITGIVLGRDSLKEIMADLSVPVKESFISIQEDEIYSAAIYGTIETYQEYFEWLDETLGEQILKVKNSTFVLAIGKITKNIGKITKNIWQSAKTGYTVVDNFIEEKLSIVADKVYKLSQFFERIANEVKKIAFGISERIAKLFSKPVVREGMVVVPSTERDEEIKEKIKAAFSDEVEVRPKDKESGIIVPVFREKKGDDYMYILVPINPIKD